MLFVYFYFNFFFFFIYPFSNFSDIYKNICPFFQNPFYDNLKSYIDIYYASKKKEKTYKNYKIKNYILSRFYCDNMMSEDQL